MFVRGQTVTISKMSLAHDYSTIVTDSRQTIAANVRAWMGRRNVTQTALAAHLGCSQPVVSRRVRGEMPFDTDELIAIAGLLRCDLSDLVENVRSRCFSPDLALVPPLDGSQLELEFGPVTRDHLRVVHP